MKNKEIEELLNKAKDIAKYGTDGKQHTRMFNQFEAKALLSYIEQLKNNRDKAIEEIKYLINNCDIVDYQREKIMNILKGDSDE